MKRVDLFDVIRRLRYLTDEVAIGFSCGEDSVVLADLCRTWFKRVHLFYMYVTPDLDIHKNYMRYWTERMGTTLAGPILQYPHFALSTMLQSAVSRDERSLKIRDVPRITIRDIEVRVCSDRGVSWFAYGHRKVDSLERRGMISECDGINLVSHRAYPLAEWKNGTVAAYLREKEIFQPQEYTWMTQSYGGGFDGACLWMLKNHFPSDYEKVVARFPYSTDHLFRYERGFYDNEKEARYAVRHVRKEFWPEPIVKLLDSFRAARRRARKSERSESERAVIAASTASPPAGQTALGEHPSGGA